MNEQYKNTLIEIEEKIKNCENDEKLLSQLKKDREYILNCLSFKVPKNNAFDFNIKDTKEEISNLIVTNQLYCSFLSNVSFINKNDKKIEKLFNSFLEEDIFGLKEIYQEISLNNRLFYIDKSDNFFGKTTFISSIKRNFIEITKSKKLYEATSIIHELGHAKTNIDCYNINLEVKKNSFLESYSIFLELMFADYLKNNGKKKQGYELKYCIYQNIKDITKQLYEDLEQYEVCGEENKTLRYFFEYNYTSLKGYYLALYFYNLYKVNQNEALKIINNFIKEVKNLDDKEITLKLNLNKDCFSNNNVYKLYEQLKEEKTMIKQK